MENKNIELLLKCFLNADGIAGSLALLEEMLSALPSPEKEMKLHEMVQNFTDALFKNCDAILLFKPRGKNRCNVIKTLSDEDSIETFQWVVHTMQERMARRGEAGVKH